MEKIKFDYGRLVGRIIEKYGTRRAFANALDMSESTLSQKLTNHSDWNGELVIRACILLDIPLEDISQYFFCPKI